MTRSNNLADLKTAFELYLKGCNLGDSGGCASVAGAYESGKLSVARSFENSLKFYERAKKN